jgi:O-antigen/teichoic acid export membrane protein
LNDEFGGRVSTRTAGGATLLIALRLVTRCIDLVTLLVLGRLLSPADFGLVAIAMSIIMVTEAVMELPVIQALVRLPALTKADLDTAFTLGLLRGLALALILLILAWPFALAYGDPRLICLISALAISPAARSLGSPRMAAFSRNLDFRPHFVIEVAGKIFAFAISVSLAWSTQNYWSLASATIAAPVSMVILTYVLAPYWPTLTLQEWRKFSGFLGWSTASQVVNALNWQMDQLLLGRFVNRLELGRFSMAANLAVLPTQVIVMQVLNPLMVAFSLIRGNSRRLAAAYQNSATAIVGAGIPIMVGMSLISEPMIRIILGRQWIEAASILRWLSLAIVPSLFVAPLAPLSMALSNTKIFLRLSSIEFIFKFPLLIYGTLYHGIAGVLVVRLATGIVVAACSMFAVRKLIRLPIRTQVFGPWRPILSCLVMAIVVFPLERRLAGVEEFLPLALGLAAVASSGAAAYGASIFLLWRLAGCPDGFESRIVGAVRNFLHEAAEVPRKDFDSE